MTIPQVKTKPGSYNYSLLCSTEQSTKFKLNGPQLWPIFLYPNYQILTLSSGAKYKASSGLISKAW